MQELLRLCAAGAVLYVAAAIFADTLGCLRLIDQLGREVQALTQDRLGTSRTHEPWTPSTTAVWLTRVAGLVLLGLGFWVVIAP